MSFSKKKIASKTLLLACLTMPVFALTGCGDKDPKVVVTEKVTAMWESRKQGKDKDSYQYLPPSLKKIIDEKSYIAKFGGILLYKKVEIKQIDCDNKTDIKKSTSCKVTLNVVYETKKDKMPGMAVFTENWVKENGDWWFYDK